MDFEKLKRKRGRKSKKELEFIKKYEEENNINLNKEEKKPKKRGRKPKGGKIVKQHEIDDLMNNQTMQNIILHLKCSEQDVLKSQSFLSDLKYNPIIGNIEPYNSNESCKNNFGDDIVYYNIEVSIEENEQVKSNSAKNSSKILHNNQNINDDYINDDYINDNKCDKRVIWEKLKVIQNKLHCNNINNKQSSCFWCTCKFDNPSVSIPIHELSGIYKGYGCFCMPECAVGYLFDENIESSIKWERYSLLNNIYKDVYNYTDNIKPAPKPFYLLDKYYGDLTIEEYRSLNRNNNNGLLMIVNKPMTRIMPELFNDTTGEFMNNTNNESKNKYKLSRKNPPINKTVINEKTWLF